MKSDIDSAWHAAREDHPVWPDVEMAIKRAKSRVKLSIRPYDPLLISTLCDLGAARHLWPADKEQAQQLVIRAINQIGDEPDLKNFAQAMRQLTKDPNVDESDVLRIEERLHSMLQSRACKN